MPECRQPYNDVVMVPFHAGHVHFARLYLPTNWKQVAMRSTQFDPGRQDLSLLVMQLRQGLASLLPNSLQFCSSACTYV